MVITLPARPGPLELDIERTALIVVDMQNGFCKKGGMLDVLGMLDEAKSRRVIEVDRRIMAAARRRGIRTVYLRHAYGPDLANAGGPDSPNYWKELGIVAMREHPEWKGRFITIGTWDGEIVDELKPQPGDITVDKNRYSGFANTGLDTTLRELGIKYLLFIGIATNVCVESTLRDAYFHEYFPVMVSDGCGNIGPDYTQEATIWNVAGLFGWVTTADELEKALK